jgi:adenylate kinase
MKKVFKSGNARRDMRIAVTGTPGTGKTTVAKALAERGGYRYIDLGGFAEENGLILDKDTQRDTKIVNEEALKKQLKNMDNVIFDGHYAEQLKPDIIFVIRTPPKILKERLAKKFGPEEVKENLLAEILDSCLISAVEHNEKTNVFEIENRSQEETLEKILRLIAERKIEESVAFKPTKRYLSEKNLDLL